MKKTAIILLAAFGIAKAQLKVQTNGAVTIPFGNSYWIGTPADAGNRVRLHHSGTDSYFDFFPNLRFRSGANASYETMILNTNGNLGIYGSVFSFMYSGGYKFASIEGRDYGNYNGAIHFNIARSNSPTTTLYNVFKVDYQGNSFLYGNAYSQQYWMWSDKKLKTNIKTCSNALTKVLSMRGVDYTPVDSMEVLEIVQPIQTQVATDSSSKSISQKSISTSKPEFKKVNKPYGVNNKNKDQIGFIAQELELIVPQAVKTDENGLKAVNYMAVIPLLVEAIKELNTKNELMDAEIKKLKKQKSAAKIEDTKSSTETSKDAILYQNTPNPFSGETQIKYYLPETTQAAFITITDLNGKQVQLVTLSTKGESSTTLKANELQAGMYIYTLVTDGNIIDSKRMVIVE